MFDVVNILGGLKISRSNELATVLSELGAPVWLVEAYGTPYTGEEKEIVIEAIKSGKYDSVVRLSRGEFVGLENYSRGWDKPIEKKNIDISELEGMLAYLSLSGSDLGEKFIDYLNGSPDEEFDEMLNNHRGWLNNALREDDYEKVLLFARVLDALKEKTPFNRLEELAVNKYIAIKNNDYVTLKIMDSLGVPSENKLKAAGEMVLSMITELARMF